MDATSNVIVLPANVLTKICIPLTERQMQRQTQRCQVQGRLLLNFHHYLHHHLHYSKSNKIWSATPSIGSLLHAATVLQGLPRSEEPLTLLVGAKRVRHLLLKSLLGNLHTSREESLCNLEQLREHIRKPI
jgi:hypothetical protein